MKKLIITAPDRVLDSLKELIEAIWASDHHYERLDNLDAQIVDDADSGKGE